jgi:hypothetical protein
VLAGADRLEDQRAGDAGAADQLDHDVDLGPRDQRAGIVAHLGGVAGDRRARARSTSTTWAMRISRPARRRISSWLRCRTGERAAADDPGAEQADLERLHAKEGWLPDFAACRAR